MNAMKGLGFFLCSPSSSDFPLIQLDNSRTREHGSSCFFLHYYELFLNQSSYLSLLSVRLTFHSANLALMLIK